MISVDVPLHFLCFIDKTHPKTSLIRNFSILSTVLFHVYVVYLLAAWFRHIYHDSNRISLAYLCLDLISYALWCSLQKLEKRLLDQLHRMQRFSPKKEGTKRSPSVRDKFLLTALTLLHVVYVVANVCFVLTYIKTNYFISLGFPIENGLLQSLVTCVCSYGYFWIYLKWPCLALWSVSYLLREAHCILRGCDERLKEALSNITSNFQRKDGPRREMGYSWSAYPTEGTENSNLTTHAHNSWTSPLKLDEMGSTFTVLSHSASGLAPTGLRQTLLEYFDVVKTIRELKDVLSLPCLLLIMLCFTSLYTCLANLLKPGVDDMHIKMIQIVVNAATGGAILIFLPVLGAKIPECMSNITATCGSIIEAHQFDRVRYSEELFLLERIEKMKNVYISASSLIVFKESFILTAFVRCVPLLIFGVMIYNFGNKKSEDPSCEVSIV